MNTKELANTLAGLLKTGKFEEAQKELFAQNTISIEPEMANLG